MDSKSYQNDNAKWQVIMMWINLTGLFDSLIARISHLVKLFRNLSIDPPNN